MKQPEGFIIRGKEHKVFRLKKAIYGLKQASHSWWEELKTSMSHLGFVHTQSDAGVFIKTHKNGDKIIVIVYVDDALFASSNKKLALEEKAKFMKKVGMPRLGRSQRVPRHENSPRRLGYLFKPDLVSQTSLGAIQNAELQIRKDTSTHRVESH